MRQFTTEDIFGALRNVNLDQTNPPIGGDYGPEFQAAGSEYAVGGDQQTPSCLVGTIVHKLDPDLFAAMCDSRVQWPLIPSWVRRNFADEANVFLCGAQGHADERRGTWRQSLASAGAYATTDIINTFA